MFRIHTNIGRLAVVVGAISACAALPAFAVQAPKADLVSKQQLRVCSDPADLPFSNEKREGFENKIGDIIADELKRPVENVWYPKSSGFLRRTLFAKRCDLVIGWGQGDELVLNTNHIYRSVYAMVVKADGPLASVDTLSDPALKEKRLGVIAGTPPADHMAYNHLMGKAKPYSLTVDRRYDAPGQMMVNDIASGEIDAGLLWGPLAAYWSTKTDAKLKVIPLLKETKSPKLHYRITLGVRQSDDAWKRRLNEIIAKRQGDIDKVLLDYGVPLLVDEDTSMEMITKPRPNGGVAPPEEANATPKPRRMTVPIPGSAASNN